MSTKATVDLPAMPSSARLIATLAVIAMLSGFLVVLAHQITLEPIARNHSQALERAVFTVLPGATSRANFYVDDSGARRLADGEIDEANVFAGYDDNGQLVGFAIQASARGYADLIRVLYGYSPERQCIIGFTVLQSAETPGLGDKIETDPAFLSNFECLDVRLNPQGTAPQNPIVTVPRSSKTEPWEIDGITGATVSSVAVGRALRQSTSRMVPLLARYRNELTLSSEAKRNTR